MASRFLRHNSSQYTAVLLMLPRAAALAACWWYRVGRLGSHPVRALLLEHVGCPLVKGSMLVCEFALT